VQKRVYPLAFVWPVVISSGLQHLALALDADQVVDQGNLA